MTTPSPSSISESLDCRDDRRRRAVRRRDWNGLDYLEVSDDQRTLTVYFLGVAPKGLTAENVRITGGRRIRDIQVVEATTCPPQDEERDNCIVVRVDRPGDFSTYTLCLVDLPDELRIDPRYRCLDFSFKVACPSDQDCAAPAVCPPEDRPEPEINYLAKDYQSFRQLMLDRLSVVMPDWTDHLAPDLGTALVEVLAYVGDHLSYYQDAVATEAYLQTARKRISVRRHARLVDYRMHEGCNARALLHLHASTDVTLPAAGLAFLTGFPGAPDADDRLLTWDDLSGIPASRYEVFEPVRAVTGDTLSVQRAQNEISIYTWGDAECCLLRGATTATLVDGPPLSDEELHDPPEERDDSAAETHDSPEEMSSGSSPSDRGAHDPVDRRRVLHLRAGDLLIFEEVIGPETGNPADADPAHRHAVRLTRVEKTVDPLTRRPLLEVTWADADALPFPLCLSTVGPPPDCDLLTNVSVARGNVVLVDHGRTRDPESLGCVPEAVVEETCLGEDRPPDVVRQPGRFRPRLNAGPLTFAAPVAASTAAADMLQQDPREALPALRLHSAPDADCLRDAASRSDHGGEVVQPGPSTGRTNWRARRDLLASGEDDFDFVVEVDEDGRPHLRFGDGDLGREPVVGTVFAARYRTGNGADGNVGAGSITLAVTNDLRAGVTLSPQNPLPARGGTPPEPVEEVKQFAPHAFRRKIVRAVTAADYAHLATQHPAIQGAAAELRWNGSWTEARVAVDPLGRTDVPASLLDEITAYLFPYRRIGHDLDVRPAEYVFVDLALDVCVAPAFLRGHVRAALRDRFSTRRLPDGSLGFFHPDALTFGDSLSLSRIVAAAQAVTGVESVRVTRLERLFRSPNGELAAGKLPIGALEVPRLDNDPSFPEHGRIQLDLRGGR